LANAKQVLMHALWESGKCNTFAKQHSGWKMFGQVIT